MAKLTEYPAATSFDSGDILIKDGTNGTKKISVDDASVNFIEIANQTVDPSLIPTIDDCVLITNNTDGVRKMLVSDISGNAHSRELTYSQYQALSNAEKINGTTYYVTNDPNDRVSGGGGGSSENYSYTEQAVGTWVDGSTIYKKTIHFETPISISSSGTDISDSYFSGMNIGQVIRAEIVVPYSADSGMGTSPINFWKRPNNQGYKVYVMSSWDNVEWMSIWYTKTTDTV